MQNPPAGLSSVPTRVASVAPPVLAGVFLLHLFAEYGGRKALLGIAGLLVGAVFARSGLNFAGAWRALVVRGDPRGVRAQMIFIAVSVPFFAALIHSEWAGEMFSLSSTPVGAVRPMSVGVLAGAALFGVGAQLGGACVSGNMLLLGRGSLPALAALAMFVAGATFAAWQISFWNELPALAPFSFNREWGATGGAMFSLALAGGVAFVLPKIFAGRRKVESGSGVSGLGSGVSGFGSGDSSASARGIMRGAVALGLLAVLVLLAGGQPLGVVNGLTIVGGKILAATGAADLEFWDYWATFPRGEELLAAGIFAGAQNVTNVGIILGGATAALLAGGSRRGTDARDGKVGTGTGWVGGVGAAVLGGLMMGYGAQISFGCNLGGFISATASGSLHGWLWLAAALAGTAVGAPMRKWFRLGH